jgi:hypothetical protein
LIKAQGYHEGLFDISVEFSLSIGNFGPTPDKVVPSTVVSVTRIGLQPTAVLGPQTVNAAQVNPKPPQPKGVRKRSE